MPCPLVSLGSSSWSAESASGDAHGPKWPDGALRSARRACPHCQDRFESHVRLKFRPVKVVAVTSFRAFSGVVTHCHTRSHISIHVHAIICTHCHTFTYIFLYFRNPAVTYSLHLATTFPRGCYDSCFSTACFFWRHTCLVLYYISRWTSSYFLGTKGPGNGQTRGLGEQPEMIG
jgi:hypothetical protein